MKAESVELAMVSRCCLGESQILITRQCHVAAAQFGADSTHMWAVQQSRCCSTIEHVLHASTQLRVY